MRRTLGAIIALGVLLLAVAMGSGLLVPACACAQPVASGLPATVDVVIALVDIPVGTVIEPSMIARQTILASAAEPDVFQDPTQVVGQTARYFIKAGSQIKLPTFGGAGPLPSSSP